jgi:hypothetical protein
MLTDWMSGFRLQPDSQCRGDLWQGIPVETEKRETELQVPVF